MEQDPKVVALTNATTEAELQAALSTMCEQKYYVAEVRDLLVQKKDIITSSSMLTVAAVGWFFHKFASSTAVPLRSMAEQKQRRQLLQTKEVYDMIIFNLIPKVDCSSVYSVTLAIHNIHCSATTLYGTKEAADALLVLLRKATPASLVYHFSALATIIEYSPSAKSFYTTPAAVAAFSSAIALATAKSAFIVLRLLKILLVDDAAPPVFATREFFSAMTNLSAASTSDADKLAFQSIADRLSTRIVSSALGSATGDSTIPVTFLEQIFNKPIAALIIETMENKILQERNKSLEENLAKKEAILAKLQSPATSDMIRESFQHVCISDAVSHDQLCSLQASVTSHVEHLAQNPVTQVLTSSINQQSARIGALREEVAKFQSDLAWAASTFPQVQELSALNAQLLTNDNFNKASICDLERSIAHSNKLLPVVLGDNFSSLIGNAPFNGCVKDQNPQGIDTLSSCWLAIRAAELEMKMFKERKLAADEHFFGMLRYTQLEFLRHVQIDEAAAKLDSFNQSCIAALASHHDHSRQEILQQEEEQHFMLNHDCVFDNLVIDEHFASRIMLSCASDSSFSSSVQEETSAHRVIMQEFELAQQRVQIEIDERIAREFSILDEERTLRQIVEDVHRVGRDILMREQIGEMDDLSKQFNVQTNEISKFNWFLLACHELNLKFPAEFSKEKSIRILEDEGFLLKEEFVEVTDQTLRTCGFSGAIINRLRKVIDHLSSASSFSSPAVQSLLDEVKSQLPGVLVLPPAEIGLRKSKENKLGAGGYGIVYTASIISQRNRRCAAKIFYDKNIAIQEARNLFHLDHPNVVRLLGVTVEDVPNPSVVLLFELADCDLKRFNKSKLPLRNIRGFIKQIVLGLDYLHQTDRANGKRGIVHLDIKPENILVFRIGSSIILKISDLGFVHEMETSSTGHRTSFAATERYLSPETRIDRLKSRKNSNHNVRVFPAIDIFAFGIILLRIIAPTWYKRHGREQLQTKMDEVIHNEALLQSNECCIDDFTSEVGDCDDLVQLVKDCLMINRKIRPQNGAALLQRLTSSAAAQDFDVVNDSSDDSSSSSDDDNESGSDENDNEGGDNSTSNPNRHKRLRNTRSDFKRDGFPDTNNNGMPQTGRSQGSLGSAHQTLDDE